MFAFLPAKYLVIGAAAVSLLVQMGFAVGLLGPAWLSPILSLPSLVLVAGLWRRAERDNRQNQAFTSLVI